MRHVQSSTTPTVFERTKRCSPETASSKSVPLSVRTVTSKDMIFSPYRTVPVRVVLLRFVAVSFSMSVELAHKYLFVEPEHSHIDSLFCDPTLLPGLAFLSVISCLSAIFSYISIFYLGISRSQRVVS